MNSIAFYPPEDPFLHKQPVTTFGEELHAPLYAEKPKTFGKRLPNAQEVAVCGAVLLKDFPDSSGVLATVYADFERFLSLFCEVEGRYPIRLVQTSLPEEVFRLSVSETECILYAGDTEGVRRALYFLEDEMMRRGGPFLPKGITERTPFVKRRISRNFFTPHKANLELQTETDYYPDGYLARLAHDGVNGLWIFLQLKDLIPSRIVPEYGKNSAKMLEKLRHITEKCAQYGIRVYGLGIEPYSTHQNAVLLENHEDMLGSHFWGSVQKAVCPSTEKGRQYIEECMYNLFSEVPSLSGFIGITLGEAVAGCGSVATRADIACPHCKAAGRTKPQALAETERLLKRGMQKAKPDAEFISWTYAMRGWTPEMQAEHCKVRDASIPLMNNFEDKGTAMQLGKPRTTLDYWLSHVGPGAVFQNGASFAEGTPLYAKLQVCASHELATVPYVPVPGILYDKYKRMKGLGVTGAMYCWFFGNYPSLMNKAAGELACLPFPDTKEAFLLHLATLYTNSKDAETLSQAWQYFEKGYSLCPYNVAFAWFGPLNDAPARPLHLLPIDTAVPSNWLLSDTCEGDRFGEWTGMMHTPEEAETLLSDMDICWKKGLSLLTSITVPEEMRSVAEAISILITSAKNMFSFYLLRNRLGYGEGNETDLLRQMEEIARAEIAHSTLLADLCKADARLGYHSEAVGYKFFPEKLLWRAERLREMLETEFPVVRDRIAEGKTALSFFEGEGNYVYPLSESPWENFVHSDGSIDPNTKIRVRRTEDAYIFEIDANHDDAFSIEPEFRMFIPYIPVQLQKDGTVHFMDEMGYFLTETEQVAENQKWNVRRRDGIYTICLRKSDFSLADGKAFRFSFRRLGSHPSVWHPGSTSFNRLMYGTICPGEKVFIL